MFKSKSKNNFVHRNLVFCGVMVVLVMLLSGCSSAKPVEEDFSTEHSELLESPKDEPAGLVLYSIEEQEDTMVVSTSYCLLKYPFAFSDLIKVEAVDLADSSEIVFKALIGETEYKLFTIAFNGTDGIFLGTMNVPERSAIVDVYAELYSADENMDDNALATFYAAQEVFNDVVFSLAENESFTPVE